MWVEGCILHLDDGGEVCGAGDGEAKRHYYCGFCEASDERDWEEGKLEIGKCKRHIYLIYTLLVSLDSVLSYHVSHSGSKPSWKFISNLGRRVFYSIKVRRLTSRRIQPVKSHNI